jgi:hypothetical protein
VAATSPTFWGRASHISVLIASAVIGLLLVVLVQGGWTSLDILFVAALASSVMAMVIGQYVNQMGLLGLW